MQFSLGEHPEASFIGWRYPLLTRPGALVPSVTWDMKPLGRYHYHQPIDPMGVGEDIVHLPQALWSLYKTEAELYTHDSSRLGVISPIKSGMHKQRRPDSSTPCQPGLEWSCWWVNVNVALHYPIPKCGFILFHISMRKFVSNSHTWWRKIIPFSGDILKWL